MKAITAQEKPNNRFEIASSHQSLKNTLVCYDGNVLQGDLALLYLLMILSFQGNIIYIRTALDLKIINTRGDSDRRFCILNNMRELFRCI